MILMIYKKSNIVIFMNEFLVAILHFVKFIQYLVQIFIVAIQEGFPMRK